MSSFISEFKTTTLLDDHRRPTDAGYARKDQLIGLLYRGDRLPSLVCFGEEKYRGTLSINEVYEHNGELHLSKNSMFVLNGEKMDQLKKQGMLVIKGDPEFDGSDRIFLLLPSNRAALEMNEELQ
jgi:hypothetical protein